MPAKEDREEKREFIREKIVKQPLSKREQGKRLIFCACTAAMFGVIAAVSFTVAKPLAERYVGSGEDSTAPTVHFTKDEPESLPVESAAISEKEDVPKQQDEEKQFQKQLDNAMRDYALSEEHVNAVYVALRSVGQKADKGIVTIRSGKEQQDLFGNPIESTGNYAGAVIARTRGEYLIFTSADGVRDASSIQVAFYDGSRTAGSVKQIDEVLDMAVVSVPASELSEQLKNGIELLPLGNSYSVKAGDPVIGVGGPAGMVHSMTTGTISYVAKNVSLTDGMSRILYADLSSNARVGTFLLNMSGELIGWSSDQYAVEGNTSQTAAVAISDYKVILEKMSNGVSCAYFGIRGQEITEVLSQHNGIPRGVYVTDAVTGGPAYDAGIQNGDVIVKFGGAEILSFQDLQTQIESIESGKPVMVTVMRQGREGYAQLEYYINIRAR